MKTVYMFQFQYGTIKRSRTNMQGEYSNEFQFQYGTIKRKTGLGLLVVVKVFQFQYGTIKRIERIFKKERRLKVSIPIWYN